MAEVFRFAETAVKSSPVTFVCYSERGLISYLMFRYFYKEKNLKNFLKQIQLIDNQQNPFRSNLRKTPINSIRIFSECDLGDFGCPDGIIAFEFNTNKYLIFIEAKLNESVEQSNKGKRYGSTINGQLELKWRMFYSYFELNQKERIEENDDLHKFYEKDNVQQRILNLNSNGVALLFENYFKKVDAKNIFFIALTNEKNNTCPFVNRQKICVNEKFKKFNNNFGWINIKKFFKDELVTKGLLKYKRIKDSWENY